jgi:unsaturated chondroitin disaccharide hydrolase
MPPRTPRRSSFRSRRLWAAVAAATLLIAALLVIVAAAGAFDSGGPPPPSPATTFQVGSGGVPVAGRNPPPVRLGAVQVVPSLALSASGSAPARQVVTPALPAQGWDVSFDLSLSPGSRVQVGLGATMVVLDRTIGSREPSLVRDRTSYRLHDSPGWSSKMPDHVEVTSAPSRLNIDGQPLSLRTGRGGALSFRVLRGRATVTALIVSAAGDAAALLFHRLAELHARVPPGLFPFGADTTDKVRYAFTWTSGFWAGSLWEAAALEPAGGMFARWALEATIDHFPTKPPPTHDVGFMYGESWRAAWDALCRGRSHPAAVCPHLKSVAVAAANELRSLAATNPGSGTIPTTATSSYGDTIIDSMMNLAILTWAGRVTGNPAYDRLASHHAHVIASLLVRRDGSTAQAVNFDRTTGTVLSIGTHQGLSDTSTWARGQAWAVYGFAQTAAALRDRSLLAVAQRAATYVAAHLPADGVPLWDYNAPAGSPIDVSAGVITAAGLLHLAGACREMPGACRRPGRWTALARRMLASSMQLASREPPVGFLGPQLLNERRPSCWCNHGELIFGLTYALEAVERGGASLAATRP